MPGLLIAGVSTNGTALARLNRQILDADHSMQITVRCTLMRDCVVRSEAVRP
jgi:hypothetical protein